jgi:hypothetical protein
MTILQKTSAFNRSRSPLFLGSVNVNCYLHEKVDDRKENVDL